MTKSTMPQRPPQDHHPTSAHWPRLIITITFLTIAACSTTPPQAPDLSRATTSSAPGYQDDLTAALATAQRLHSLAVLTDDSTSDPGTRTLTLLDNLDNRVTIRIIAKQTDGPDAPTTFDIAITYGLWGDQTKENKIIQTIQHRLKTLAQRHPRQ